MWRWCTFGPHHEGGRSWEGKTDRAGRAQMLYGEGQPWPMARLLLGDHAPGSSGEGMFLIPGTAGIICVDFHWTF